MASPIWNEKRQRWSLRITSDYKTKEFTSSKQGLAGKKEVLRKVREWQDRGSTDAFKARCSTVWDNFIDSSSKRLGAQSEAVKQFKKIGSIYILPAIGHKRMSSLRQCDYQKIIDEAKPHNKRTEVLSKKYLTTIRATINQFIKFGVENDYCEPLKGTLYIPQGHPTKGKEILQPDQIRKLFEPSDVHYHLALCFMCVTGLRPSECLGLQWKDIKNGYIEINRGVNSSGVITAGKNKNAKRMIPLSPIVQGILDRQRDITKHLRSEWIFCSQIGDKGSQSTLGHNLDQLCEERGFNISPYSLRHTFVSMVKNSMPEQMVRTLVGHSSSMDTFGVYGHRVNGELMQAAKIVDLTFNDIRKDESQN